MRRGCRTSKYEKACSMYSYQLGRCKLGRVKYTCSLCEQPKAGTKKAIDAAMCQAFYGVKPV